MIPNYLGAWRKHRNISQDDAATAIGTTKSMYGKLERGERTLDTDWMEKISRAFRCEPYQLIAFPPGSEPGRRDDAGELPGMIMIKEADLVLGFGGAYLDGPVEERAIPFPEHWVRQFTDAPAEMLTFIRGRGDSMEPTVPDGAVCLLDLSRRRIDEQDALWAVAYGELGMVKRLRAMPDGSIKIMSDNPNVAPEHATDGELYIIGRCCGVFRKT